MAFKKSKKVFDDTITSFKDYIENQKVRSIMGLPGKHDSDLKEKLMKKGKVLCEGCGKFKPLKGMCIKCHKALCKDCVKECGGCKKIFCDEHLEVCKDCGKTYCESCEGKHVKKCEDCEKSVCKAKLFKCGFCKDEFCKDHIKKCPECGKSFCEDCLEKDHGIYCPECNEFLGCEGSKKKPVECGICLKPFCNKHLEKCPVCNKMFCQECLHDDHKIKCVHCDKDLGCKDKPKSAVECKLCGDVFCKKHVSKCPDCGQLYCEDCFYKDHIINCEVCQKPLSKYDRHECERCSKNLCKNHQDSCPICGHHFCSRCNKKHDHGKFLFFKFWRKKEDRVYQKYH